MISYILINYWLFVLYVLHFCIEQNFENTTNCISERSRNQATEIYSVSETGTLDYLIQTEEQYKNLGRKPTLK